MQKQNTKNIKFKLPVHVKTLIFSALLVLISLTSHSQYKLLNSPQHSANTYVYQITDLQAFEFIYGENEKVDSTLFSNCIDTLSFNEAFKPIKYGHYLQVNIKETKTNIKYTNLSPFKIEPFRNTENYSFLLLDSARHFIENAQIITKKGKVKYNKETKLYSGKILKKEIDFWIKYKDQMYFYFTDEPNQYRYHNSRLYANWTNIKSKFVNRNYRERDRYNFVFDKPYYLIGDTVQFHLSKYKKNGRLGSFKITKIEVSQSEKKHIFDSLQTNKSQEFSHKIIINKDKNWVPNRYTSIAFFNKNNKEIFKSNIQIKDVKPQINKVEIAINKNTYENKNGDSLYVDILAKDALGLPLTDLKYTITSELNHINNHQGDYLTLPKVLFTENGNTDEKGKKRIFIPTDSLKSHDLSFRVNCSAVTKEGENFNKTFNIYKHELSKQQYNNYPVTKNKLGFLLRSNDSLLAQIKNPERFKLLYKLWKNKKIVWQGFTETSLQYTEKAKIVKDQYRLEMVILEQNNLKYLNTEYSYFDKNKLNIAQEMPMVAEPGQTIDVKLKVTDVFGKPVENVNIVSTAYDSKFEGNNVANQFNKNVKSKLPNNIYKQPEIDEDNSKNITKRFTDLEKLLNFGIDTIDFYQFLKAKEGVSINYEKLDVVHGTQYVILINQNESLLPIHYIMVDGRLEYVSYQNENNRFSFHSKPGKHNFSIRLADKLIEIDSISLAKNHKTTIIVDLDSKNPLVKVTKLEHWENAEINRIMEASIQWDNYKDKINYIKQGNRFFSIINNNRQNIISPVWNGQITNYGDSLITKKIDVVQNMSHIIHTDGILVMPSKIKNEAFYRFSPKKVEYSAIQQLELTEKEVLQKIETDFIELNKNIRKYFPNSEPNNGRNVLSLQLIHPPKDDKMGKIETIILL